MRSVVFQPFFQKRLLTHPVGTHERAAAPKVRKGWAHLLWPRAPCWRGPEPGGDPGSLPCHPSACQPGLPCSDAMLPFFLLFLLGKFDQVASERVAWSLKSEPEWQALGAPRLVSTVTGYGSQMPLRVEHGLPHRPGRGHTHTASPGPAPHPAPPVAGGFGQDGQHWLDCFLSAEWALPDSPQGVIEDRMCLGATASRSGCRKAPRAGTATAGTGTSWSRAHRPTGRGCRGSGPGGKDVAGMWLIKNKF